MKGTTEEMMMVQWMMCDPPPPHPVTDLRGRVESGWGQRALDCTLPHLKHLVSPIHWR